MSEHHLDKESINVAEAHPSSVTVRSADDDSVEPEVYPSLSTDSPSGSCIADSDSLPSINHPELFRKDSIYTLIERIGSGGMSTVYKAQNRQTGVVVAIKILSSALAKDKSAIKRFEQECHQLSELNAPELLTIYGSGQTDSGEPYLVMEFIEGSNLSSILEKERKLLPDRAIQLFLELCQPIAHAHRLAIVHRDIKPSNIIVSDFGTETEKVQIVDFGIARIVDQAHGATTSGLTQTGTVFGTPTYMSPEQCNGDEVDQRTDLYSLGCVMYEVLSGYPPFDGSNPVQVAVKHINDLPPPLPDSKSGKMKYLWAIIQKCLEKDKTKRYSSIEQLQKDLIRVQNDGPISYKGISPESTKFTPLAPKEFLSILLFFYIIVMGSMLGRCLDCDTFWGNSQYAWEVPNLACAMYCVFLF
ncbi:MAG: serine/threonine protein kinase, partial [Cyanobacteria bacterium]|nr:serine/threonine protein kinase [Cyanobacteriota bacterium]